MQNIPIGLLGVIGLIINLKQLLLKHVRFIREFKKRQFLKQMKAIKKTQKCILGIALALLVVYPASVLSQIAVYDFSSDDEGFTVETVGAVPGPWEYNEENGQWVSEGSEAGCGGPYHDFLTSPDCIVTAAGDVTVSIDHRHAFEFQDPSR